MPVVNESSTKVKDLGDDNMDDEVSNRFKDSSEDGFIVHRFLPMKMGLP